MKPGITPTYGLTHLAISVKDIERTMRFYTSVFEMAVMYHEKDMVQLTTPGCNDILVFQADLNDSTCKPGGIAHFGFRLRDPKDIEALTEKVVRAGGIIKDRGKFVPGSPYIFFLDPDGYEVEIWYELLQGGKEINL
jgi:catechol 2,3-dioxygenase-like lactoylglutathione lyase family enzyme